MPTEFSLKKSFEATFVNSKERIYLNGTNRVDLCCRTLHKCDAHKHIEFNYTNESNIRHCKCEFSFQKCLKNLNTSLSNELAFLHSVNTTKCYSKDHPIIKCMTFDSHKRESIPVQFIKSMDLPEHKSLFGRCLKYDLDQSKPQKLQLFDVPFNYYASYAFQCKLSTKMFLVLCFCLSHCCTV